jgi:hypothetical protein
MSREFLPYHEWILQAIGQYNIHGMYDVAEVVKSVELPPGFIDKIIAAWTKRAKECNLNPYLTESVLNALNEQKKLVEDKEAAKNANKPVRLASPGYADYPIEYLDD